MMEFSDAIAHVNETSCLQIISGTLRLMHGAS